MHNKRNLVKQLIENINYFCPNSTIVLFNGGDDPNLCKDLNVQVCPTSRKLQYGYTTIYFLETMEWIEQIGLDYDYFINIDSDALFITKGYEEFVIEQMQDTDYLGVALRIDDSWFPGWELKKDIDRWKPFFTVSPFYGVFNVGQIFTKQLVKSIVNYSRKDLFKKALNETPAFGTDEIVYVNLAKQLGYSIKTYPKQMAETIRYRPHFTIHEIVKMMNMKKYIWLCHPIHRDENDPSRQLVFRIQTRELIKEFQNEDFPWFYEDPKKYSPSTPIYSQFGCFELVCREESSLFHYYKYKEGWTKTVLIAEKVNGAPLLFESNNGNFEVIASLDNGGIGHWWRNNSSKKLNWSELDLITNEVVEPLMLTQLSDNQLLFIARKNNKIVHWIRVDDNQSTWLGPYS